MFVGILNRNRDIDRYSAFYRRALCVSIRRRHTSCALVTGVQTCALPISLAGAEATGLFEGTVRPSIVAHSFGSAIALKVAANPDGARFGRLIVADNGARPPRDDPFDNRQPWTNPGHNSLTGCAARFRLPPQPRSDHARLLHCTRARSRLLPADP